MTSQDLLEKSPKAMGELWNLCYHARTTAIRRAAERVDKTATKHRAILLSLYGCGDVDLVLKKIKEARHEIDEALAFLHAAEKHPT